MPLTYRVRVKIVLKWVKEMEYDVRIMFVGRVNVQFRTKGSDFECFNKKADIL